MRNADTTLKRAILNINLLSEDDMAAVINEAECAGQSLKDYLIKSERLSERQILIALTQSLGLDLIEFSQIEVDQDVVKRVSTKIAWYYKVMPVEVANGVLKIASSYPLDLKRQDEIRTHIGMRIEVALARESDLNEALKKYYGLASDTIDRILTKGSNVVASASPDTSQWIEDLETKSDDPTVSNLVNEIILEAYRKRATDIHIEPYRHKVRFRYRIDGALVDANLPQNVKHFLSPILSRIKILANLKITEKRLPQDGSAVVKTNDQHLDLRVSTMPTPRGESMVIRILPQKVMHFSLEKLGFNDSAVSQIRSLIKQPHGIIFMTGPTGSGKTTSLYACLHEINSSRRKIITIEDPVEYEMEDITQVQVNPKVDFDFAKGLRSVLRHDPDIIMVGEVRDLETAEIAIRTALTGHLVFSSLHTNDAASGVTRLIDMGVEPYLVASSVESFIAQRLVRVICPKCKEPDGQPLEPIMQEIKQSLKIEDESTIKFYRGKGCDHCNNTGYYGRQAIYEILTFNDTIRAAIIEKPRSDYIKQIAMKEGLETLRQNGWRAVLNGDTTPEEVMNVSVKDEVYEEENKEASKPVMPVFTSPPEAAESMKDFRFVKTRKKEWNKNEYDGRSYPRVSEAVDVRYKIIKFDPDDPNVLISDGVEYPTVTEDISAAGLRFPSKDLLAIGTILEVKIQLGEGQKCIECLAKVCRVEEDSMDHVFSIVTYYLDITSADKAAINKFVEQKLQLEDKVEVREKTAS